MEVLLTARKGHDHQRITLRWWATLLDWGTVIFVVFMTNAFLPISIHRAAPWFADLLLWTFWLLYHLVGESVWGATLGKLAVGIRVIDQQGRYPSFWRAAARTVTRFLEVNPVLFGGIPAYLVFRFSKHGQRLGDMLGGTYVVRVSEVKDIREGRMSVSELSPRG